MTGEGGIHEEHPFLEPMAGRDPVRRLRGRLAAPVTIVTSGGETNRAGLTVASVMVAEGDPALVYMLIGPTTDLYLALEATGRCVVHVVPRGRRETADVFAGIRPHPGGPFAGIDVSQGSHGPELTDFDNRLRASVVSQDEASYSVLVAAAIDDITLTETANPLVWYRGTYRSLD